MDLLDWSSDGDEVDEDAVCKVVKPTNRCQGKRVVLRPCEVKLNQNESPIAGWNRGFDKYSPTKEVNMSPVTASQVNLRHVIRKVHYQYLDLYTWVVNMSEQYYYDNAFLLLSYGKRNQKKMASLLHRGFVGVDEDFFINLKDLVILGSGSFGTVYRCTDPRTNQNFAVKLLTPEFRSSRDHAKNILEYIGERNSMIQATGSPFVVKFYFSFQLKGSGYLFLFTECCIGDLEKIVDSFMLNDVSSVSLWLHANKSEFIETLFKEHPHILEVFYIYIFEMFCGLDFLVKCNIVHNDIKPANMLISDTLHLKLGDFGVSYRTRTIHRETNKMLIHAVELDKFEGENYENYISGTALYQDLEVALMVLEGEEYGEFRRILSHLDKYNTPGIEYNTEATAPSFLSDTWAVGVTALELLYRGFQPLSSWDVDPSIMLDVPRRFPLYLVHMVGRQGIYNHYIKNGMIKSGGKKNEELMAFLASIFKPRSSRCHLYTSEREVYHLKKRLKMKFVDLDKVEQLRTFKSRRFNRSNIHLRYIPNEIRNFYDKKRNVVFDTFKDMLEEVEQDRLEDNEDSQILNFEPGVTINFF